MGRLHSRLSITAKIAVALLVTVAGGLPAFGFLEYGAMGVYADIQNQPTWTSAGLVYWSLLLIGILCMAGIVATWLILFAPQRLAPPQKG